jgi:hypothetical protein
MTATMTVLLPEDRSVPAGDGLCGRAGCGRPLPAGERGRSRRFCSDECRRRHYNALRGKHAPAAPVPDDGPGAVLGKLSQLLAEASRLAATASAQVAETDSANATPQPPKRGAPSQTWPPPARPVRTPSPPLAGRPNGRPRRSRLPARPGRKRPASSRPPPPPAPRQPWTPSAANGAPSPTGSPPPWPRPGPGTALPPCQRRTSSPAKPSFALLRQPPSPGGWPRDQAPASPFRAAAPLIPAGMVLRS